MKRSVQFSRFSLLFLLCMLILSGRVCAIEPPADAAKQPLVWDFKLNKQGVDIIKYVSDDRVLVGLFGEEGAFWNPYTTSYMMINPQDGEILWSQIRTGNAGNEYLLLVDPVILVKSSNTYTGMGYYYAMDPEKGNVLWTVEFKSNRTTSSFNEQAREIVVIRSSKEELDVTAFSIHNGEQTWNAKIPDFEKEKGVFPTVVNAGEHLLVIGSQMLSISLNDHKTAWKKDIPLELDEGLDIQFDGELVLLHNGEEIHAIDPASGDVKWSYGSPGIEIELIGMVKDGRYVISKDADSRYQMDLLDNQGKKKWESKFTDKLNSSIYYHQNRFYFTTNSQLIAMDMEGKILYQSDLPGTLHYFSILPDALHLSGDKLFVGSETGLASFDLQTGRQLNYFFVEGSEPYTTYFLSAKLQSFLFGLTERKGQINKMVKDGALYIPDDKRYYTNIQYELIQKPGLSRKRMEQNRKSYMMNYQMASASGAYTSDFSHLIVSPGLNYTFTEQMQSATRNAMAGAQLVHSSLAIGAAGIADRVSAYTTTNNMRFLKAIHNFDQVFHEQYFIRPYFKDGWKMAVFNLGTGKRADIFITPDDDYLRINAANLPTYFFTQDGNLMVKGIYKDKSKHTFYNQAGTQAGVNPGMLGLPPKKDMPYPAMMCIDFAGLEFDTPDAALPEIKPSGFTDKEHDLVIGIMMWDDDKVDEALKNGANPDVKDEFGITPLMYSAAIANVKIAKSILKYSEKPELEDFDRWNAMHYGFFCNQCLPTGLTVGYYHKAIKKTLK